MANGAPFIRLRWLLAASLLTQTRSGEASIAIYPELPQPGSDAGSGGNGSDTDNRTSLYFGLIQSYDPSDPDEQLGSVGTIVGTEIALDHINADDSLLPGYRLHFNFANSPCGGVQAMGAFFQQVLNPPTKLGIIGAGCSPSTQEAALVSQFYNLTQISCIATSPSLANRNNYRRYIQLLPPEFETAHGFYSIITHYNWKRVGVILQEGDLFEKTFDKLRDRLVDHDVQLPSYKLHFDDLHLYKDEVLDFDNFNDIRIFIIIAYESITVPMLCEAYKRGLWYPRYHFLLLGWYSSEWWKAVESDCTVPQIEQALQHSLAVDILQDARVLGDDWSATDLGITNGEFYKAEKEHIKMAPPPLHINTTDYLSQYCYDATWAFAITLNKTIADLEENDTFNEMAKNASREEISGRFRMEHFDYGNSVIVERMMENWNATEFIGVTGNVSFQNGLRELLRIRITQFLSNENGDLVEKHVGHLAKKNNFTIFDILADILWKEGEPHDGTVNEQVDPLHSAVTAIFDILGILGITFAGVCLLLNYWLRDKVIIKLSAPKLNYMICVGAILLYISIILVAVPVGEGDADLASALCCMTPWFTAIGYSLCYGTILVKMFRTWYIFNKPAMKKKQMQDWMLILIVMCLVMLDVVIMAIYTGLELSTGNVASRVANRENKMSISGPQEVVTRHYVYVCSSLERNVTLGVLYGYKAILQIMALLLSFATWKVQISGLDDAKPIIVSTYVTSLVLAVVIVSTYTLSEYINAYAAVFGVGFFLGTTLILGLVFMTKIYSLIKDPTGESVFSTNKSMDVAAYKSTMAKHESDGDNSLKRRKTDLDVSDTNKPKEVCVKITE